MIELFVIYILVYIAVFLHSLFQVGVGLLHYVLVKELASKESILKFLKELKFPANIYHFALEDFWNSGEDFKPYPLIGSILTIIFFSLVSAIGYLAILNTILNPGKDNYGLWIGGFLLPVATFTLVRFQLWNFIRRPIAIDRSSHQV